MWRRLLDRLFPVVCEGKYRFHCTHRHSDTRPVVLVPGGCYQHTHRLIFITTCCRCDWRQERDAM